MADPSDFAYHVPLPDDNATALQRVDLAEEPFRRMDPGAMGQPRYPASQPEGYPEPYLDYPGNPVRSRTR